MKKIPLEIKVKDKDSGKEKVLKGEYKEYDNLREAEGDLKEKALQYLNAYVRSLERNRLVKGSVPSLTKAYKSLSVEARAKIDEIIKRYSPQA